MKKAALLLSAIIVVSCFLGGCKSKNNSSQNSSNQSSQTTPEAKPTLNDNAKQAAAYASKKLQDDLVVTNFKTVSVCVVSSKYESDGNTPVVPSDYKDDLYYLKYEIPSGRLNDYDYKYYKLSFTIGGDGNLAKSSKSDYDTWNFPTKNGYEKEFQYSLQ